MIERTIINRKAKSFTVLLDNEDASIFDSHSWHVSTKGYVVHTLADKSLLWLHRVIMKAPADMLVDHRDGNRLNNSKANLRLCSNAENTRNRKRSVLNTSGYVGVEFDKELGKWLAGLTVHGRYIDLGYFTNPREAAEARDKAALEHHGEFARLNLPELALSN